MAVDCPDHIFERLWAAAPGEASDNEVLAFAYSEVGNVDFLNAECPDLPELHPQILEDWSLLEGWVAAIQFPEFTHFEIFHFLDPWFEYDEPGAPTPIDVFKSSEQLISTVTAAIEALLEEAGDFEFGCLEVTNNQRSLTIFYSCSDAWSLGHADSVRVAR